MRVWRTRSEEETRALGRRLAAEVAPDGTLLLIGAMGSGKTVFAQGVAVGLGVDPREVQSPSFTLVREHGGTVCPLIHIDLYRLESRGAEDLGLEELFSRPAVKVVEWGERLPFPVPGGIVLRFRLLQEGERQIEVVEPSRLAAVASDARGGSAE